MLYLFIIAASVYLIVYRITNTNHLCNICTTMTQRLRRWSNIVQIVYKCFVFAGYSDYQGGVSFSGLRYILSIAGDEQTS